MKESKTPLNVYRNFNQDKRYYKFGKFYPLPKDVLEDMEKYLNKFTLGNFPDNMSSCIGSSNFGAVTNCHKFCIQTFNETILSKEKKIKEPWLFVPNYSFFYIVVRNSLRLPFFLYPDCEYTPYVPLECKTGNRKETKPVDVPGITRKRNVKSLIVKGSRNDSAKMESFLEKVYNSHGNKEQRLRKLEQRESPKNLQIHRLDFDQEVTPDFKKNLENVAKDDKFNLELEDVFEDVFESSQSPPQDNTNSGVEKRVISQTNPRGDWYSEDMILKVWDTFIQKKNLQYFYLGEGENNSRIFPSLFGMPKTNKAMDLGGRESAILINKNNPITCYKSGNNRSVTLCSPLYDPQLDSQILELGLNTFRIALEQIKYWNHKYTKSQIDKHLILFPYNIGGGHWCLGVCFLDFSQNQITVSINIYDPLEGDKKVKTEKIKGAVETQLAQTFKMKVISNCDYKFLSQQSDSVSCGVITSENGKVFIDSGEKKQLSKNYPHGAKELREKHIKEVNDPEFESRARKNKSYSISKVEITLTKEKMAGFRSSLLPKLQSGEYADFYKKLVALKSTDRDVQNNIMQDLKKIMITKYQDTSDSIMEILFDEIFISTQEAGYDGYKCKESGYDNLIVLADYLQKNDTGASIKETNYKNTSGNLNRVFHTTSQSNDTHPPGNTAKLG